MERDRDHLQHEAERARRWAVSIPDPLDRERLEAIARDYEKMAQRLKGEAATISAPRAQPLL